MHRAHTEKEFLAKARSYCARQERSQQEVRDKLYGWGAHREQVEGTIAQLIGEGFLNESRFAEHYAVSKFRQKGWGVRKIEAALKLKRVSPQCIALGLASIDQDEYGSYLLKAIQKRSEKVEDIDPYMARRKVINHFLGKGYSIQLIEYSLQKLKE